MRPFALLLLIAAAASAGAATISGRVTDAKSGAAVTALHVVAYDAGSRAEASTLPGVDGRYTLTVPAGTWTVAALYLVGPLGEYAQQMWDGVPCGDVCDPARGKKITLSASESRSGIDFPLTLPNGGVAGVIANALTGAPVANASVSITSTFIVRTLQTGTDDRGRYSATGLRPGTYVITATSPKYVPLTTNFTIVGEQRLAFDLLIDPLGSLSGTIRDRNSGVPLVFARVVVGLSLNGEGALRYTDADGRYRVDDLLPGKYFVRAAATGRVDGALATPVTVTRGADTVADLALVKLALLSGRVLDFDTHAPIRGATIALGGYSATSGPDGAWSFIPQYQPIDETTLTFSAPGYVPSVVWDGGYDRRSYTPVRPGADQTGIELYLHRGGTFSGRVIERETGTPVPGAKVTFTTSFGDSFTVPTIGDGTFRTDTVIASRPYRVLIKPPAGALFNEYFDGAGCIDQCNSFGRGRSIDGLAGENAELELHVSPPGALAVTIVDAESGLTLKDPVTVWDRYGVQVASNPLTGTEKVGAGLYYLSAVSSDHLFSTFLNGVQMPYANPAYADVTSYGAGVIVKPGETTRVTLTAPRIGLRSIEPLHGPAGTKVTINGVGLGASRVTFDSVPATVLSAGTDAVIVEAPAHGDGPVLIEVANAAGSRVVFGKRYYYAGPDCEPPSFPVSVVPYVSVTATRFEARPGGTPPFRFEWFRGFQGDVGRPLGSEASIELPAQVLNEFFWLRVGNACGDTIKLLYLKPSRGRLAPR